MLTISNVTCELSKNQFRSSKNTRYLSICLQEYGHPIKERNAHVKNARLHSMIVHAWTALTVNSLFKAFFVYSPLFFDALNKRMYVWIVSKSTHEWPRVTTNDHEWPRVTTSDHEWLRVDHEWPRVTARRPRVTTSDHEWLRVTTSEIASKYFADVMMTSSLHHFIK